MISNEIVCANEACKNESDQLELRIQVNGRDWQLEKTYFQCKSDPIVLDWFPKTAILRYRSSFLFLYQY